MWDSDYLQQNIFQIENEWLQSLHREKRDKKTEKSAFCVFKPGS